MSTKEKVAVMTEKTPSGPDFGAVSSRDVRAKDHLSMAVVLSGASVAWFGWGHQGALIEGWLRVGMGVAGIALVAAIIMVRRVPAPPTLATDPSARKVYWASVVAEVVFILLGAVALVGTGNATYVSTWVLFVVGVHFLPFVRPFNAPILRYTALGCVVASAVALWAGLAGWAPAPTMAGVGGGIVLLGFALILMVTTKRNA
ncbi:hypothetical protein [Tessaracoccus caeni]|uniref:hypothetical protein n=1 Tax=Tessaracoccus caeni TaxID=3031239 RepID=UPI0023DAB72E|nr:hypothetical protein [Tessaracoccus caeni]MDF1488431.1 hypothetical protein [Tessaracoccus caeni]